MARKINKKTRNVISGLLVGAASIYAVINFADVPTQEVSSFFLSTALLFAGIIVLAFLAVSLFKLLIWIKKQLLKTLTTEDSQGTSAIEEKE